MFFQRKSDTPDVRRQVQALQVAALQSTMPGEAAAPLNKAGDLLLQSGDLPGALYLYGRAVDSMIEADRHEAAVGLCRKIIRTSPEVVRARCTLVWLALGAGFTGELRARLEEYVTSAETRGREKEARRELRRMSEHVPLHSVRLMLAECLLLLGDDAAADEVYGAVYRERNGSGEIDAGAAERWQSVRGALLKRVA